MNLVLSLDQVNERERFRVGGKAWALARMARSGINVPDAICITTEAYSQYTTSTGLRERILLELNRKPFDEMRWEEMWDAALRIRNMFLATPLSQELSKALGEALGEKFGDRSVVVRSSAPGEDAAKTSFAGLHDSYVNISGSAAILEHVRLVWASLWSDRAMLYRQELKLSVEESTMAVVVQEIVAGDKSGVIFGKSPTEASQAVIEAVYGLNQGLVDGTVEPDRWVLHRDIGNILSHTPAQREKATVRSAGGVRLQSLSARQKSNPPLTEEEVASVFRLVQEAERLFGSPQDVEWTIKEGVLYALQSRPITSAVDHEASDKRLWYLSLTRSFENLKGLRRSIEQELLPAMDAEADDLSKQELAELSDSGLAKEVGRRIQIQHKWRSVYWEKFIPFAHGTRLFGQVYNDTMKPDDPYEFMELLGGTEMESMKRNLALEAMASQLREDPALARDLRQGIITEKGAQFQKQLEEFLQRFSISPLGGIRGAGSLLMIILQMAERPHAHRRRTRADADALRSRFLSRFEGEERSNAAELLDLARASYRLRDDDNIHLGRIEFQLMSAVEEGKRRIERRGGADLARFGPEDTMRALRDPGYSPEGSKHKEQQGADFEMRPRQLIGQPAGPGIATGKARVIEGFSDLMDLKSGEVLVCDAIDPNMTFVVPLSAAIVERRGGMLIHGAIIAREYGLPCVTGVPNATSLIRTGAHVTVDGYLGIVTVSFPIATP